MNISWEDSFPAGYGHTSLAFLKRCLGFEEAKNGGLEAASFVVSRCVKQNRLRHLRERHPDAVLLPVLGKNKLPLALAQEIGLPIWYGVRLIHIVNRKMLSAIQRLLHKPKFCGFIQEGTQYILIDDVITQGGTIAALREFVIVRGGRVVAVVALAYAIGSHAIAPLKRNVVRLLVKFGMPLILLLQSLGIICDVHELTNSQIKYLLRFASVMNIMHKVG